MSKYLFSIFLFNILSQLEVNSQTTADCGSLYTCFIYPANCVDNSCDFIYKWNDIDGENNHFIISAKTYEYSLNGGNKWLAIGFSNDRSMGDDGVVICKTTGEIEHYYNSISNPLWLDSNKKSIGISNINVKKTNDWFICSFKREKKNSNIENYFDLSNKQYYILAANGELSNKAAEGESDLLQHTNKISSSKKFSFTNSFINEPKDATLSLVNNYPVSKLVTINDCGVSKGCFFVPKTCTGADCTYIFKFSRTNDIIDFDLIANVGISSDTWLAIGFSKDDEMGDDGVVLCKSTGSVEQRYNNNKEKPILIDGGNPSVGLTNTKVSLNNGWFICSFSRAIKTDKVANYFDLNKNYFILAAYGYFDSTTDTINKHTDKIADSALTNFSSFEISGTDYHFEKYKAHGCLMIIAWIFFASTGMIIARYYKFLLPNSDFCGVQFWFLLHRLFMLFVPVLTITGFIVILAQLNWEWVSIDDKIEFTHSVFGMIALVISILQPIIAILRCEKDHKKRFIFNYVHRSLGILALVSSIVAMFLGSVIDVMFLDINGWGILIGWTIWVFILPILLEFVEARYGDIQKSSSYTVNGDKKSDSKAQRIKKILIFFHVIVALAFTIALVIIIAVADSNHKAKDS